MNTFQGKVSFYLVIKLPEVPAVGVVATSAIEAALLVVRIITNVTIFAANR
jgi:hypothetical protein